jgi:lipopolysaccharide exporter
MSKPNWLKSGFFTVLDRLSSLVFGFGGLYFLLRIVPNETFGVWVLFVTIAGFIEVGRQGLLQNAMVRYLNTAPEEDHAKIQTAGLFLNASLSIVSALLLIALSYWLPTVWGLPELGSLLRIYALTTCVLTALYQCNFVQMANLDYRGLFVVSFIRQSLFFFWVVYLYLSGTHFTLAGLAWVQFLAAIPATIFAIRFMWANFKWTPKLDMPWLKILAGFGAYNCGSNLATMSYKSVDKWALQSNLQNPGLVGSYELAVRISNLVEAPIFALAIIMFPQSAKRMQEEGKEAVSRLYEKSVGVILSLVIPFMIFIWVLSPYIVSFLGNGKYPETVPVLQVTVLFGCFLPYAVMFGTVIDSIGKPRLNFLYTLAGAFVNLACNFLFIKQFGLMGAAYGTLFAYVVMFVAMQLLLHKELGIKPWRAFAHILPFYSDMWAKAIGFLTKKAGTA